MIGLTRARGARMVSPHVLKALPRDIILENGFYVWGRVWGNRILLGVKSRRYEHSGSKKHYAHRNEGRTYKSHRDNLSQFWRGSFEKSPFSGSKVRRGNLERNLILGTYCSY